jgi:hypothetical protein
MVYPHWKVKFEYVRFEVFRVVKISMLVFRAEDGDIFLRHVGTTCKSTRLYYDEEQHRSLPN